MIGICCSMAVLSPYQAVAGMTAEVSGGVRTASGSNAAELASDSNAKEEGGPTGGEDGAWEQTPATSGGSHVPAVYSLETGDLWEHWVGDLSFLNGSRGDGTEEKPYQISTREHLMGLSELAAMGMTIEEDEGTYPGDYRGAHFVLARNLDLGGMDWMPIGFYREESGFLTGEVCPFDGHFDGNGKTISNFYIRQPEWSDVGLFGAVERATIRNLTVKPGHVLEAGNTVGILVGTASDSVIRDVTVMGTVRAEGTAGGVAGVITDGTVVENCVADHVALDTGSEKEVYGGGIAGKATESLIVDCTVNTGDSITARIQGDGYIGGITGFQNGTDIFNVHVMGTIGGSGSQSIGGVTGKYASGKMKVARFEGTIADSGMGSLSREGTFIGTHDTGFHFRYGTEEGADLAYLFANAERKISAGVCGSGILDDNSFGYDAHIGFWHGGDNHFTLVQGQNTKAETGHYFYEELENGILHVIDSEDFARDAVYTPDHFAPNAVGRPARGYLVSVLQIDTAANVEDYYDVATLTARGASAYSRELDKETRGAVAAGDVVTVMTAPKNTAEEKYQMEGVPTFTDAWGQTVDTTYQTGGSYTFVMPAHDTEVSAVYQKVAADIRVEPEEIAFRVTQERSGDRRNPSIVTTVRDGNGKLIARYVNGDLAHGTEVQEVTVAAVVDRSNDVADSRVAWSVDDSDLLILKKNEDEDHEGYTAKRASIELNLDGEFFKTIVENAEKKQQESGYRYAIPDTVYGNGLQGGLAVLTAKTRPAASFEGKPVMANCRIPVTFQIKDRTIVAIERVTLDKPAMEFTVTRTLTGNRRNPKETLTMTGPQTLSAAFQPGYFDGKSVQWSVGDPHVIRMEAEVDGVNGSSMQQAASQEKDNRNVLIHAVRDAKWMTDLMAVDDARYAADERVQRTASGVRETEVTVVVRDELGNEKTAACPVTVRFVTEDQTTWRPYGGGGSGGSGGSGGGSGSSGSSKGAGVSGASGAEAGVWKQGAEGRWSYEIGGVRLASTWRYIHNPYAAAGQEPASWFYFDHEGTMCTGWLQDPADGSWYYLHPTADGQQGYMYRGWHVIDGRWYFFGEDGRMYAGGMTPDGYTVDETGAWVVDGMVQMAGV